MKPIYQAWWVQIEVTNACPKRCAHCTRAVRHVKKPFFMSLDDIDRALRSMRGWPRVIGCMGGEPTIHPEFEAICHLYAKYFPRERCGLWTSGGAQFEKHKDLIIKTFACLLYNDHSEVGQHQPWLIGIDEVVPDEKLRNELIDNCWIQKLWSPSINPKGAFFCEIAAVMSLMFDVGEGYAVEPGWWRRDVPGFRDQRDMYCGMCSMALPFGKVMNDEQDEYVSKKNRKRLEKIKSPWVKHLKVIDKTITRADIEAKLTNYKPWDYLGPTKLRDKTGFIKAGYAAKREHSPLSAQ